MFIDCIRFPEMEEWTHIKNFYSDEKSILNGINKNALKLFLGVVDEKEIDVLFYCPTALH